MEWAWGWISGLGWRGWLRCSAPPLGGAACRVLRHPRKWQLGFWSLCISLSVIHPHHIPHSYFSLPLLFLCICCSGRCLSRYKYLQQRVPGPTLCQLHPLLNLQFSRKFPNAVFSTKPPSWGNLETNTSYSNCNEPKRFHFQTILILKYGWFYYAFQQKENPTTHKDLWV